MAEATLTELLNILPKNIVPKKARTQIDKLIEELDQLLFVDAFDEVSVDRSTLMRITANKSLVPAEIKDHVLVETSKHLGRRVKEFKKGSRRIRWVDGGARGLPINPMTVADVQALGITSKSTVDEIATLLRDRVKDIPPALTKGKPLEISRFLVDQMKLNRSYWDCLVANLGFWAAVTFIGGFLVFVILLGSGVPWPIALLIAGIFQTGVTLYFLLQCAWNPNFNQR
jgi:hypothetical protein